MEMLMRNYNFFPHGLMKQQDYKSRAVPSAGNEARAMTLGVSAHARKQWRKQSRGFTMSSVGGGC